MVLSVLLQEGIIGSPAVLPIDQLCLFSMEIAECPFEPQLTFVHSQPFIHLTRLLKTLQSLIGIPLDVSNQFLRMLQLLLYELLLLQQQSYLPLQFLAVPLELQFLRGYLLGQDGRTSLLLLGLHP
jgi:hypothetical protein